jgi:uncharacterized phage-associated protein
MLFYIVLSRYPERDVSMVYNAVDVARFIVGNAGEPVSNLKLQKMLYFAWVGYYNKTRTYLFGDDICAWKFGPVIPSAYSEFRIYGGMPITTRKESTIRGRDADMLKDVISACVGKTATSLVNMAHRPGGPWERTYDGGLGDRKKIPFERIVELECQ